MEKSVKFKILLEFCNFAKRNRIQLDELMYNFAQKRMLLPPRVSWEGLQIVSGGHSIKAKARGVQSNGTCDNFQPRDVLSNGLHGAGCCQACKHSSVHPGNLFIKPHMVCTIGRGENYKVF